jgi:hypothetical protein
LDDFAELFHLKTHQNTMRNTAMEQKWVLSDFVPALPSDWQKYGYLVLEVKASSPQYFELAVETAQGARSLRVHPLQAAWIRASIPLEHFREPMRGGHDLASLGNKPRNTFFVNFHRNQGPLDQVEGLRIRIPSPVGSPTVEVRSVRLSVEDPGDAVLSETPLVDAFGQWISEDWPGKAHTIEELQSAWAQEEALLEAGAVNSSRYGGFLDTRVEGSFFFRVEQIDGKWWFVDPEGYLFFSTGADCIGMTNFTRIKGREELFAEVPPEEFWLAPREGGPAAEASFSSWNLAWRYGEGWQEKWMDATIRRMDAWGLNTVANWSDPRLGAMGRKPYVVTMSGWGIEKGVMGLPNIYEEGYAEKIDQAAASQCAPRKMDPWLLGYFIANEPAWPERELLVTDTILSGPSSAIQEALKTHLAAGNSPERRVEFVFQTFEKFLDLVCGAIRKHDPNHLNLGIRFGGTAPEAVIRMAKVFDVYSHNIYHYAPDAGFLDRIYSLTGRPMIIGEFHFGTPGRGMDPGLCQTLNQEERAAAYRYYVENGAAHHALIGTHWFQWWDQPNTGRMDGENYQIGLVDVTDRAYPEMVSAMQETHRRLYGVHSGTEKPVSRAPVGRGEAIEYE